MREKIISLDAFRIRKAAEELAIEEKEKTDVKIRERLKERGEEIVSAELMLGNITADDFLELIKYLKKLREETGVVFKVENFKTNSDNPIMVQGEDSQRGFAPIQIILAILAGTIVLGGIVGGVLYFAKPANQQSSAQQQGKCGDGICGATEEEKGVCEQDCKDSQQSKTNNQTQQQINQSSDEINFHQLATGKNFGDILKLFNPVIDEVNRKLYVVGSKTTNVGVVDLNKDELVETFDIGVLGGFLIFNNNTLYSFDFSAGKCYQIDLTQKTAEEVSKSVCESIVPKDKNKTREWKNYSFKISGYQSFSDGTTGFSPDWRQDLNASYGVVDIYDSSNNKKGEITLGPDALYYAIDQTTGKLYSTITGDSSVSIFDLNKLESTDYCKNNSCLIKEVDIGNSADEVIVDSSGNMYVRNRLGGSVIYKYNIGSGKFTIINNENHETGGLGLWPTDMELSKDEKRLYVLGHYGALIDVIDTTTNKVASKIKFATALKPRTDSISAMVVDKSRDRIYAVWPELGIVGVADGKNGKVLGTIDLTKYGFTKSANAGPGLINLTVSDEDNKLFAYLYNEQKMLVFNGDTLKKENDGSMAASRKSEGMLMANGEKGELYLGNKIIDIKTLKETSSFSRGQKVVAFNNDKKTVYLRESTVAGIKTKIKVYEFVSGSQTKEWTADNLGEIINTFFDFKNNVFYIADFLSGTVKKQDLTQGSAPSNSGSQPASSGGQQTPQTQGKCGDGVCGPVEKEKGVCPVDCK